MAKLRGNIAKQYGNKALEAIVQALVKMRHQQPNGDWVLQDEPVPFDAQDVASMLLSIIELGSGLESMDRRRVISAGIFEAIKSKELTPDTLVQAIDQEEHRVRNIQPKGYVLATYISIDNTTVKIPRRQWQGAVITFSRSLPASFTYGALQQTLSSLKLATSPERWMAVRVAVKGRTGEEAADRAFFALNSLRSLWNLKGNLPKWHSWSSPVERPINEFRLSPLKTIHYPTGDIASRGFWYEEPYIAIDYPGDPTNLRVDEWEQLAKFEKMTRDRLRKLPYQRRMLEHLQEYVGILDRPPTQSNFHQLWAILEKLTACNEKSGKADYSQIIKRASFLYEDEQTAELMLKHLKDVRNNYVHDLTHHDELSTCFYQLLRIVHVLLDFHLRWGGDFRSITESGQFLQLSTDAPSLENQIRIRETALKFMGKPRKKK